MSSPEPRHSHGSTPEPQDAMESIVHAIPLMLPLAGGLLMLLLAFIAVYLA